MKQISAEQLSRKIAGKEHFLLLDCRTPAEFREGHIEGAVLIPVNELAQRHSELDKDMTVVVYCHSGNRSSYAAAMLDKLGFVDVFDLDGGTIAWEDSGFSFVC